MKTIVITGASGSGKSFLSNKLSKEFNNSIVIKTDSYYRDSILIKILSIFILDIYDRPLSIMKKELIKTIRSIYNKNKLISVYEYNFKRKHSSKNKLMINYSEDCQFLIIEGIFSHRLGLNYQETINIVCEEEKKICFTRRLKRDHLERGRDNIEVFKKFNKSWYLFYDNVKKYLNDNHVLSLNTVDINSYNNLVLNLQSQKKITKKDNS